MEEVFNGVTYREGDLVQFTLGEKVQTGRLIQRPSRPHLQVEDAMNLHRYFDRGWQARIMEHGPIPEPEGRYTLVKFSGHIPAIKGFDKKWYFVGNRNSVDAGKTWTELLYFVGNIAFEVSVWEEQN